MIKGFDKEAFMREPVEIEIKREMQELPVFDNTARLLAPMEQSIVLHVGGQDYDIRELVYRLLRAEGNLNDLQVETSKFIHKMEKVIRRQEEEIQLLKMRLG